MKTRLTAEKLAELSGLNLDDFGRELLDNSAVLGKTPPSELIAADFKEYDEHSVKFGVGQVEVINLDGVGRLKDEFIGELKAVMNRRRLDCAMLLITDVIRENSVLVTAGMEELENLLVYRKTEDNIFDLPGILSRKKQLLPELLRAVEERQNMKGGK